MIRFEPPAEPAEFDARCRTRGRSWLAAHPNPERPRDYWRAFKPQLAAGFGHLCAYSVMYEPVGTIDHFLSWKHHPDQTYEWNNYRFASPWVNSSKQLADGSVLDPFDVGDDWFELKLPSLQLVLTDRVPSEQRATAEFTLIRLHLRDDERVVRQRREWYRMYQDGELSLEGLRKKAPLIARAVARTSDAEFLA